MLEDKDHTVIGGQVFAVHQANAASPGGGGNLDGKALLADNDISTRQFIARTASGQSLHQQVSWDD